jgi:diguanylate cyclase (GGDEF)-like protein
MSSTSAQPSSLPRAGSLNGRAPIHRGFLTFMLASPRARDPAVRERLLQTILDRRATVLAGAVGTLALAFAAIHFTGARWPYLWLVADVALIIARWSIMIGASAKKGEKKERDIAILIMLGTIWSLLLGLALCACMISGNVALMTLAAVVGAGAAAVVTSRNAATPRHAMLVIVLIGLPMSVGMMLSPHPGMVLVGLLFLPSLLSLYGMIAQNHAVTLRLIEAELRARVLAETDTLTGLYNRMYFRERLGRLASQSGAQEDYGLLCLDLDGFKAVNDTHGHTVGDTLLQAVAQRIRGAVRQADIVFRMGGDEFMILLPKADPNECRRVAQRVIEAVSAPYGVSRGLHVTIGASVGSVCAHISDLNSETVLHAADEALYRAKADGKGVHVHA